MEQIMSIEILSDCIMAYIGHYHFRFVAGVNRTFYMAYTTYASNNSNMTSGTIRYYNSNNNNHIPWIDQETLTFYNVSTIQHAKICYEETTPPQRCTLCALAAKDGSLHVLKYLVKELDCPWDVQTCSMAGRYGHVHILEYARRNGCDWNDSTLINAAQFGHLPILEWALQHGYTYDTVSIYVSSNAAEFGQWHILKWLHARRCPFHEDVARYASNSGHQDIVRWLCALGY